MWREVDIGLDETETREHIGLNGADLGGEHHVAHEREHVRGGCRLADHGPAEEVVDEVELEFTADDAAERADGHTEVARPSTAICYFRTARIAAEVVAEERTDEPVRVGVACRSQYAQRRTGADDDASSHRGWNPHVMTSGCVGCKNGPVGR